MQVLDSSVADDEALESVMLMVLIIKVSVTTCISPTL